MLFKNGLYPTDIGRNKAVEARGGESGCLCRKGRNLGLPGFKNLEGLHIGMTVIPL